VIVFGEAHLRRILGSYAAYYNESRTHPSLSKDTPLQRATQSVGAITHHSPSSAAFTTIIALLLPDGRTVTLGRDALLSERRKRAWVIIRRHAPMRARR
jgi:hypothetical protein